MSKFWQKKYISKYTGEEIDAAVAKAGDVTKVVANPTLAGTEAALTGLQVGDTKYKVANGVNIIDMDCTVEVSGGNFVVSCSSQETFEDATAAMAAVANIGEKALTGEIPLIILHVTSSTVSTVTEGDIFVATYAETCKIGANTPVFFSLLAPADAHMLKWQPCFARPEGTTGTAGNYKFTMTFISTLSA